MNGQEFDLEERVEQFICEVLVGRKRGHPAIHPISPGEEGYSGWQIGTSLDDFESIHWRDLHNWFLEELEEFDWDEAAASLVAILRDVARRLEEAFDDGHIAKLAEPWADGLRTKEDAIVRGNS
jgi:hypothetical protein